MILKKLLSGLDKKYVLYTVLTPAVMIGEVLMETFIPFVMAKIIDNGIAFKNLEYVLRFGSLMILMTLVSLACGTAGSRLSSVAAYGFGKTVRKRMFQKIQRFSFSQIDEFGTGSLVTRLTTDVTNLQNMYQNVIRSMVRSPFMLAGGTVMACFINSKLACLFIVTIPLLAAVLYLIASTAYPRFKVMFEKYDALNTVLQENFTAVRTVKSCVREDFEIEKFSKIAENLCSAQRRAEKIVIINGPVMQFVIYMCIAASLWFGGNLVLEGSMKTGELVSFITYVTQILMSLMMISMIFVGFILTRVSISRVLEILDLECGEQFSSGTVEVSGLKDNSVEFENVSFSYERKESNLVLSDINLKIPSGASVGIIGGTGSSKSTLVSLIPRLYEPLSGKIKIGGQDISKMRLEDVRGEVSIVLQKSVLFSGTILENLKWGNKNASLEEIEDACKKACAHDFIMSFPDGYSTELGQSGVNLSGGQKQRLCIARAFLKKSRILILDDSTSALDTATDACVRRLLKENFSEMTKIIISQRISSIQDADLIVVMDKGNISGTGTHQSLLAENKIYRELFESQMSRN